MAKAKRKRGKLKKAERQMLYLAAVYLSFFLISLGLAAWFWGGPTPNVVARVLFSETASCSSEERALVAGVMQNRIGMLAFGRSASLEEVVTQRGAFSCVNDAANSNWNKTRHPSSMSAREREIWSECLLLLENGIPPARGPSGHPLVYYHDRSIDKPSSWDNEAWHAVEEVRTKHFIFYSIVAVRK